MNSKNSNKTQHKTRDRAFAFGRYFEEFEKGDIYHHFPGKTITESDNNLFSLITMNHHPIHLDNCYASQKGHHKKILVVGTLVFSLVVGLTVRDISGKAIANLCYENIQHQGPVFIGDTIYAESEVLEKRGSKSKPDRGIIYIETRGYKKGSDSDDKELVISYRRKVLIPKKMIKNRPADMHRSFHFIPATKLHYLETKYKDSPDNIIIDIEDSVAESNKEQARQNLLEQSQSFDQSFKNRLFIRVNHKKSCFYEKDIELVKTIAPAGIMFPKVEETTDFEIITLNNGSLKTILLMESIKGLKNLDNILNSSVFAVALGLEDLFSHDFMIFKEDSPSLVAQIKMNAVFSAKAFNLKCLDSISLEFKDISAFEKICMESRSLGFDAMLTIHPKQIGPVNKFFSPLSHEVEWAKKIMNCLKDTDNNQGYKNMNGIIIGPPKIKKAKKILNRSI